MAGKSHKASYICSECGYISQKWLGKCPNCDSWGTFEEEIDIKRTFRNIESANLTINKISEIEIEKEFRMITKYQEFDSLIVGIDYFNGEEKYIEKYFSHEDSWYFGGPSRNFYIKLAFRYYYGLWGTELDIFLKNIGLEHLI